MMEKLKPCPFCGGEAELIDAEIHPRWYVRCKGKYCVEQSCCFASKTTAVMRWNRRVERSKE